MAVDTLYDLLGVPRDADTEEIRTAYRRLTKIYHPDVGGTPGFFRLLQDAHDTLTDPFQRGVYDRSLTQSGSHAKFHDPTAYPHGQMQNYSQRTAAQPNGYGRPRQGNVARNGSGHAAPGSGRILSLWSRQPLVMTIWITSAFLVGVLVAIVLEAALGIVLLILILLAVVAVVIWRRRVSGRRKAETRDRAEQATAEFNRMAWEAAERERAARAAATRQAPASSSESVHAAPEEAHEERTVNGVARSGEPGERLSVSRAQFEYMMAVLFGALGLTDLQRVSSGDDFALDIAARDSVGRSIVARCRRCTGTETTGARDVRLFIDMAGTLQQNVLKLLVTTSDFTSDARILADRHGIQLISGPQVEQLVRRSRHASL